MKIKELIETLKKLPQESKIKHLDGEYGTTEPVIEYNEDRGYYWITEGKYIEGEDY
jgi:hypothetical protein